MKAILTYHSIDDTGSPISIAAETFAEHVRWLAQSSVPVLPLSELVDLPGQEPGIAVTFDDGFENFGSVAWPLMQEHGIPATVFVVSNHVGGTNDWSVPGIPSVPRFPLLSWDALGKLADEGAEIGAHTLSHADLTAVSDSEREAEIGGVAEAVNEAIGQKPASFAYPYGRLNGPVQDLVRARYSQGCTTELRWVTPNDVRPALPRLDMYYFQQSGQLEKYGSSQFRRRIQLRRVLRAARAIGTSLVKVR